jgi:hypothetical protein
MPTKKQADVLRQLQEFVSTGAAEQPKKADFASPKAFKDSAEDIHKKLLEQKYYQRADILKYIENMARNSFIFLVVIVISQMIIRIFQPKYTGVSDTVINILTAGVFGQVLGIVATITAQVWKAPKSEETVPLKQS